MKQIETLLQRYRNGEITPEEQAELNRLTHRDEILHAAASRAAKIRRQRTTVVSSVASVVIVAAVFLTITANNSTPSADTPLLAQNVIEVNEAPAQKSPSAPLKKPRKPSSNTTTQHRQRPSAPSRKSNTPNPVPRSTPLWLATPNVHPTLSSTTSGTSLKPKAPL